VDTPGLIEKLAESILDGFWPDLLRSCIANVLGLVVKERDANKP
jgi:hypothetical protein